MTTTNLRVLLAEDDTNLGFALKDLLEDNGMKVKLCVDGEEAVKYFYEDQYDICILDIMLPLKDGYTVASNIRGLNDEVPIIFLTAKSQLQDKLKGLETGADDYITKPFEPEELLLRIKNINTRYQKGKSQGKSKEIYSIGSYILDYPNLKLSIGNIEQKLTSIEAKILRLLSQNKNQILERNLILNAVWGKDDYFTGRSLDVFITKLRKYLKEDPSISIENIPRVGFRLNE